MDKIRYKEICNEMDSSLAATLNLIRRYVWANQASVMVGAGFSKNADMNPGAKMLEWNALGEELYKKLYNVEKPGKDAFYFKSPIRLASQLASFTTHTELDRVISDSLPDKAVRPGALHKKLMQLPWRDVFTTNYDTLLERTQPDWKQNYTVVTNRKTLIYTTSPRIIKLHGSFPDQHPYIMTEEDFRTYPNEHPEFVNTVRQSLIENLFCLIGFSGDDENFQSWIGWLRDVIGKESVLCYLITYDKKMHDSEASLLQERGITPVKLDRLPLKADEGYGEALDFFLTYITPQKSENGEAWTGDLGEEPYQDLAEATNRMREIRESYPGWPFLPVERLSDFEDIERHAPFLGEKFEALNDEQKYEFATEILWRIQISYSPLNYEWLNQYMETYVANADIKKPEVTDMALQLLSSYRKGGDFEKFKALYDRMEDIPSWGTSIQVNMFIYQAALSYVTLPNLSALKALSDKWKVGAEDSMAVLWKTNILTFLGEINEAKVLLEAAIQYVKTQIRSSASMSNKMMADVLQASLNAIAGTGETRTTHTVSLYRSYTEKLKIDLLDYMQNGRAGQRIEHKFNVGKEVRSWRSGKSGLYGDYIYSHRYVAMRERIGYPMGCSKYGIDVEHLKLFLPQLVKYEPAYATSCVLRSMSTEVAKCVFTREILHVWPKKESNELIGSSMYEIFTHPKTETECNIQLKVLFPFLSRMCIRFERKNVKSVFDTILAEAIKHPRRYDLFREELSIVYDCADEELKAYMAIECVKTPIPEKMVLWEIEMPTCLLKQYEVAEDVVAYLANGLTDDTCNSEKVVRRIQKIWGWLSKGQKEKVGRSILAWRQAKCNYVTVSTYEEVPPTGNELEGIPGLCEHIVSQFEQSTWNGDEYAASKDTMLEMMDNIIHLREHITEEQYHRIYVHVCEELLNIYRDKSAERPGRPFAGEDYYIYRFDQTLRSLVRQTIDKVTDKALLRDIAGIVMRIDTEQHPLLEIKLRVLSLQDIYNYTKRDTQQVRTRMLSKHMQAREDGFAALTYLMSINEVYFEAVMTRTVSVMMRMSESAIAQYLDLCAELLVRSGNAMHADRLTNMLREVYEVIDDVELPFELRTDLMYYAGKLAGVMSCMNVSRREVVDKWETTMADAETDTDVFLSYEKGKMLYGNR